MRQKEKLLFKTAEIVKALGHPCRLEILCLLGTARGKKMSVTEIYQNLRISQPQTSRHLAIMKNTGVLLCERLGSNSFYFINEQFTFIPSLINYLNHNKVPR
jgi:DNA-binding transcriptional ArsR family regulator